MWPASSRACLSSFLRFGLSVIVVLLASCDDRLPTDWIPPSPTISDNAFILEGNGFNHQVFNFSMQSARGYYFPEDAYSSIWNADSIFDDSGRKIYVTVQISFPGDTAGAFEWEDAYNDPFAKSKVRVFIVTEEWVSTSTGNTTVEFIDAKPTRRVRGSFEGILQNKSGSRIIVSHGVFHGPFF